MALSTLLALLLPGCSQPAPIEPCTATANSPGATPVCFSTTDGWILQGVEWNRNETNSTPILLVHGLNEDHHPYDGLAQALATEGRRVVAFDSRGHGASTLRSDGTRKPLAAFSGADIVSMERDLDPVLGYLAGDSFDAVGASIGANELLRFAAHADREARLVLLSAGLDYRGLTTMDAAKRFQGPVLFMASKDDPDAVDSAHELAEAHTAADETRIWDSKGHGTQMLDEGTRAEIEAWLA